MKERTLQSKIKKELEARGWLCWVNHGSPFMPAGLPDMMGIHRVYGFAAIEVKVAKNKPTKNQVRWVEKIRSKGHRAGVAWSVQEAIDICEGPLPAAETSK